MRIVSLLPSTTEILFALGAGDQVVGVTFECDTPAEARERTIVSTTAIPEGLSAQRHRRLREQGDGRRRGPLPPRRRRARRPRRRPRRHPGPVRRLRRRRVRRRRRPRLPRLPRRGPHHRPAHPRRGARPRSLTLGAATGHGRRAQPSSWPASATACMPWSRPCAPRTVRGRWSSSGPTRPSRPGHWVPEMVTRAGGHQRARRRRREVGAGHVGRGPRQRARGHRLRARAATTSRARRRWHARRSTTVSCHAGIPVWAVDANASFARPGPAPRRRRRGAGRHPAPGRDAAAAPGHGATAAMTGALRPSGLVDESLSPPGRSAGRRGSAPRPACRPRRP